MSIIFRSNRRNQTQKFKTLEVVSALHTACTDASGGVSVINQCPCSWNRDSHTAASVCTLLENCLSSFIAGKLIQNMHSKNSGGDQLFKFQIKQIRYILLQGGIHKKKSLIKLQFLRKIHFCIKNSYFLSKLLQTQHLQV